METSRFAPDTFVSLGATEHRPHEAAFNAGNGLPISVDHVASLGHHITRSRQASLNAIPHRKSLSGVPIPEFHPDIVADEDHLTLEQMFDWSEFRSISVWRSGVAELFLMALYVMVSGGVTVWATQVGGPVVSLDVGLGVFVTLTLFIMATAAISGAHFNPMITWTAVFTKLCSIPRAVIYLFMHIIGALLGGAFLRVCCGPTVTASTKLGSWGFDPSVVTVGQAFCLEFLFSWSYIWITWGTAIDPKQQKVFGPVIGPVCVGLALGLNIFVSGGLTPGFGGAGANPAKFLGLAVAANNYQQHWIPWIAPLLACIVQGAIYWVAPPHHEAEKSKKD
ncbi:aquaporin-like protein [Basidiobolus meristosporus CBS 931.73]|uniref:Aquaporin-like protein n=1 Tax=Basidiobolus meristosporus CBS 931.73 TaxID=1314790 RepID=A0A1Y1XWC2_9FUNG|nr:aquaporin-like protein [Basidiobolus meristosporus CBS 931.73]|eukprot:ORX89975.1 aquaporin-like protein [Basidiobolus meristosporus CBS 931.73]